MRRLARRAGAALLAAALAGCGGHGDPAVEGRWQRVGQPREWVSFGANGTFTGQSYMEPREIRGRFRQEGARVTVTSETGHTRTLTLRDSVLTMDDGTRYQRAR